MILKTLIFLLDHKFTETMVQSFIKLSKFKKKPTEIIKLLLKSIAQSNLHSS